jgi:hypothetical protein
MDRGAGHELRQTYPTADPGDIAAALHYGRESVNAAEAYRDDKEGRTLSEATGIPEDMPVKVYFRLRWGEGEEAEYKIFAVEATGGSGLATLGARARLIPQQLSEEYDYPLEEPDETILFKVDFFNDP